MFRTLRAQLTFANVAAGLALFVALATGGAYAAGELIGSKDIAKNAVKSKHIGKGQVKGKDLAHGAVTSASVADRSLLSEDFASGEIPKGAKGDQGIQGPAGSARAWALVGSSGSIQRSFGVIGDATTPSTGVYCIELAPSIDLDTSIVITGADLDTDGTDPTLADKSLSEWSSDRPSTPCPTTKITVRTYVYNGDTVDDGAGGDTMTPDNESFTFLVP
jgi:hypothetical protein